MLVALQSRCPASLVLAIALLLAACEGAKPERDSPFEPVSLERAQEVLAGSGCVACHAAPPGAEKRLPRPRGPDLERVGARVRPSWLRGFLAAHAGAPDANEIENLVHFLAARGGPFIETDVELDPYLLERGRQLYHGVGCVACHEALEVPEDLELPLWRFQGGWVEGTAPPGDALRPLDHLAAKTSSTALAEFLEDPLAVLPDGRMPSMNLSRGEARSLAAYLTKPEVRADHSGFSFAPGLHVEYFEGDLRGPPEAFDELDPVWREIAGEIALKGHRDDRFGFRFNGFIDVPADGDYTFFTTSDDGSFLLIDGRIVVDNGGDHGMIERSGEVTLAAGKHALTITMFENAGGEGLEVAWSGPGFEKEPLPSSALLHWVRAETPATADVFQPDPSRAAAGGLLFDGMGCGACHDLPGRPLPEAAAPLASLDPDGDCSFAPNAQERGAVATLVAEHEDFARPLSPAGELHRALARLDCYACHERGGVGGPPLERVDFFQVEGDLDLGDEGRLPPHLDGVGAKLRPETLANVLLEGETVRPYMTTRMPQFGAANVAHLTNLFAAVDAPHPFAELEFDRGRVENGRKLAGTGGLGCIQCHNLAGLESTGIPAVDLATVYDRIRPGWFRTLMLDPKAIGMNSRMPVFWQDGASPVVDVYGGDPVRQTEALWTWLSLGEAMPLPDGLLVPDSEHEVLPGKRPALVGVFMKDVSPRTVLVGHEERVHFAFDVENSRLAKVWRGRFFNARGTWHGRAGELEVPPGEDVLDLPPGVPFAFLESPDDPWPTPSADELGYRVLGRRFDAEGRPGFRYAVGGLEIEERMFPRLQPGGATLVRRFRATGDTGGRRATFRAMVGGAFEAYADVPPPGTARTRTSGGSEEFLIDLPASPEGFEFEVELRW